VNGQITVGIAVLTVSLPLVLLILRRLVSPAEAVPVRGRHRAPRRRTPRLLRPIEALVETTVRCRFEHRDTVHVRTRVTGELICRSCGHIHGGAR
jgi:hypothetical protein